MDFSSEMIKATLFLFKQVGSQANVGGAPASPPVVAAGNFSNPSHVNFCLVCWLSRLGYLLRYWVGHFRAIDFVLIFNGGWPQKKIIITTFFNNKIKKVSHSFFYLKKQIL